MSVDVIIVGGGIIGLATAYEYNKQFPDHIVVVCEKERYLGDHTTGRNSGVLHSGVYYENGSLKHLLTRRGLALWDTMSKELGFEINTCGKYLVASNYEDLVKLRVNGLENGVEIEEIITEEDVLKDVVKLKHSMFLPETSVINISEVLKLLENHLAKNNVVILKENTVKIKNEKVYVNEDEIECPLIINCAGLWAIEFRKKLGLVDIEEHYVAGHYLSYRKKYYNKSLVYPLPNTGMNTLGIHTCITPSGDVFFGPSAESIEEISYKQEEEIILKLFPEIENTFRGIDLANLDLAFVGIRPKIKREGKVIKDFIVNNRKFKHFNYIEALGIESPGLTCAFSLAEELIKKID